MLSSLVVNLNSSDYCVFLSRRLCVSACVRVSLSVRVRPLIINCQIYCVVPMAGMIGSSLAFPFLQGDSAVRFAFSIVSENLPFRLAPLVWCKCLPDLKRNISGTLPWCDHMCILCKCNFPWHLAAAIFVYVSSVLFQLWCYVSPSFAS